MPGTTASSATLPSHIEQHWRAWQQREDVRHFLPEAFRAHGYTVLRIPPRSRGLFLDLLPVLLAADQAAQHAEALAQVHQFCKAWHLWTPRLTAYLQRLAEGTAETCPPFPLQETPCDSPPVAFPA
jgi:DNA-binding PucR family transcriptional regulator